MAPGPKAPFYIDPADEEIAAERADLRVGVQVRQRAGSRCKIDGHAARETAATTPSVGNGAVMPFRRGYQARRYDPRSHTLFRNAVPARPQRVKETNWWLAVLIQKKGLRETFISRRAHTLIQRRAEPEINRVDLESQVRFSQCTRSLNSNPSVGDGDEPITTEALRELGENGRVRVIEHNDGARSLSSHPVFVNLSSRKDFCIVVRKRKPRNTGPRRHAVVCVIASWFFRSIQDVDTIGRMCLLGDGKIQQNGLVLTSVRRRMLRRPAGW